jgi:phage-related holin
MGSWTKSDDERVSPTARWFFRGVWKVLFALLVVFMVGVVVTAIAKAVS